MVQMFFLKLQPLGPGEVKFLSTLVYSTFPLGNRKQLDEIGENVLSFPREVAGAVNRTHSPVRVVPSHQNLYTHEDDTGEKARQR
jgi:hypothetical protein